MPETDVVTGESKFATLGADSLDTVIRNIMPTHNIFPFNVHFLYLTSYMCHDTWSNDCGFPLNTMPCRLRSWWHLRKHLVLPLKRTVHRASLRFRMLQILLKKSFRRRVLRVNMYQKVCVKHELIIVSMPINIYGVGQFWVSSVLVVNSVAWLKQVWEEKQISPTFCLFLEVSYIKLCFLH